MNKNINICVVEDDLLALNTLIEYLEKFQLENNVSFSIDKFSSAKTFVDCSNVNYDIIFMDIELPDGNGMELIREVRKFDKNVIVIFVTNLVQYAVKGYEVHAYDFIVKPISYYNFYVKLLSVLDNIEKNIDKEIWISNRDGKEKISVSSIYYIEVVQHMLYYHTSRGIFQATGSLNVLEGTLKENHFVSCNRCYLVNLKYVKAVKQNYVIVGEDSLLISRYRKNEFIKSLNDYLAGAE